MTPLGDELLLNTLERMEKKIDHVTERVIRVETIVDERTAKQRRRDLLSRGTWTTIISGVFVGLWELLKARLTWGHR